MSIQVLITGGTIAKRYDEISGNIVFDSDNFSKMFEQARCNVSIDVETLMLKDSLDMDDVDREIIYQSVQSCKPSKVIITHGTDTMVETAKKLSSIKDKKIILTGAMIPYAFKNSDALFNLGTAFGAIGCLDNGVYLAMNGEIFIWDNVKKDKSEGVFVSIS